MKIKCPNCKKETLYSETNPFRPFCSERCKLIDLGDWADGNHSIPAEEHTPDLEDYNDSETE